MAVSNGGRCSLSLVPDWWVLPSDAGLQQADILLLGGDLFHDNKPSRQCMVRSMKLFRQYVFGSRFFLLSFSSNCN